MKIYSTAKLKEPKMIERKIKIMREAPIQCTFQPSTLRMILYNCEVWPVKSRLTKPALLEATTPAPLWITAR